MNKPLKMPWNRLQIPIPFLNLFFFLQSRLCLLENFLYYRDCRLTYFVRSRNDLTKKKKKKWTGAGAQTGEHIKREPGAGSGERGTWNGERGTGNGERGTGNGEWGTKVWERVVSGNVHKNPTWQKWSPLVGKDQEPGIIEKRRNNR